MEEWISLRELARRTRRTHRAVQKAIEDSRIPAVAVKRAQGGRISGVEYHAAVKGLANNTDPVEALRNGKDIRDLHAGQAAEGAASPEKERAGGEVVPPAPREPDGYHEARTRREQVMAKQSELEYLEQLGKLVSAEDVERATTEIFAQLKSGVFRLTDSLSQRLAAETDPIRVRRLLSDEFTAVFDDLSRRLADPAAHGVEERAPGLL